MQNKTIIKKANETFKYLDTVKRNYDGKTIFCVNVKRYDDYVDIDKLIKKYPKNARKKLTDIFTEDYQNEIYQDWLNYEAEYFINDYIKENCTDYEPIKKYSPYWNDDIGLYGRGGGWFGIESNIEDRIDAMYQDIQNGMSNKDIYNYHDVDGLFSEIEAIQWLLNEAKDFNNKLSFEEELEFRLNESLKDIQNDLKRERELRKAKKIAEKYNYILASAI